MPVAPNPLLQTSALGQQSRTAVMVADKSSQAAPDRARAFDQMMARQEREAVAREDRTSQAKPKDKPEPAVSGNADDEPVAKVAEDGNNLPGTEATSRETGAESGQASDTTAAAQAQSQAATPVLQAASLLPSEEQGPPLTDFDPDADPLAGMPALRLALEQSAQAQGTTSAHAATDQQATVQASVNTLASLIDAEGESEPGDEAFGALLEDGLKDIKGAASDSRVDDFSDRLAALTQAVTPKTANIAASPSPLQQPLAMNQNAWSEGLVNRVMYLSSQNLKSADIQLEPAELGRLDIRINVAPDQAAQVTFISGHAGVRDALDSQLHRLRELFAQQGLAQPDVNVADQSRGQQQQQGQPESSALSGVAARRAAAGEGDPDTQTDARQSEERQVVIGSSAVDYYA